MNIELFGKIENPIFRVGLDLDDTTLENDSAWNRFFREQTCLNPEKPHRVVEEHEVSIVYDYFRVICEHCFDACLVNTDVVLSYEPIPGALEAVKRLHSQGVEFHIITARPILSKEATLLWLDKWQLSPYVASITFAVEKRPICEKLGLRFMIDDSVHIHKSMQFPYPSQTQVLFVDCNNNKDYQVDVRFTSWTDIESTIQNEINKKQLIV